MFLTPMLDVAYCAKINMYRFIVSSGTSSVRLQIIAAVKVSRESFNGTQRRRKRGSKYVLTFPTRTLTLHFSCHRTSAV